MKTFYFNIQSKGGVGKSFLTALLALKYESDPSVYFVDLDSSVKQARSNSGSYRAKIHPGLQQ